MNPQIFAGLKEPERPKRPYPTMLMLKIEFEKAGDYYVWRDLALLENEHKSVTRYERNLLRTSLRHHQWKVRHKMNIK